MITVNLPFTAWEPDRPDYNGKQTMLARGVIPAAGGYRPFPAPLPFGPALPAPPLGAVNVFDRSGAPLTVAGTADKLYMRATTEWTERGTGFSGVNNGWSFAQYGDILTAVNGVDPVLYSAIGLGSMDDFQPAIQSPAARCAAVFSNFLIVGGLSDYPNGVQWSAIDDPLSWPEPGSNEAQYAQSDRQIFPDGGRVQALISGMAAYEGLIFCEKAIHRAQYVGPPYVFQFSPVDKSRGVIAPRSVIQAENLVYFLAEDGFYATDGSTVRNIGIERINLWWRANSMDSRRKDTIAAYDPINGLVAFAFASTACPAGLMDSILVYHPALNGFSLIPQVTRWLYTDTSRGVTLEGLDDYGPLDSLSFSLDSKDLLAGVRALACFGEDNTPRLFTGEPVEATLETAERGGERLMVHGARPMVDGAPSTVSIFHRASLMGIPREKACSTPWSQDGICRLHLATRYARARITIPGGVNWTHATGVDVYVEQEGWK